MNLHIYSTPDEVIGKMAEFMVSTLNDVINKKGICHLVLTGGNSPKKLYELLAYHYSEMRSVGITYSFILEMNDMFPFTIKTIMGEW